MSRRGGVKFRAPCECAAEIATVSPQGPAFHLPGERQVAQGSSGGARKPSGVPFLNQPRHRGLSRFRIRVRRRGTETVSNNADSAIWIVAEAIGLVIAYLVIASVVRDGLDRAAAEQQDDEPPTALDPDA